MTPLMILVGIAALMLLIGAGVALFMGGGKREVDERLEEFVAPTVFEAAEDVVVEGSGPDVADRLDKALSGRTFFQPLREKLSRSDMKLRVSEYIIVVLLCAAGMAAAGYFLFNQNVLLALVGALVGMQMPRWYLGFAANRRMNAFNDQLGDTLNLWVNALRSGYSVLQGMETIATELPPPVSVEFERVVQEVRLGLSVEQALNNMYRRVPSEDLDLVITAVNIQREVGGNLAEVLDTISFTIRERVRIKGEIRTLTAQGRASAWIISLLPVALGLLIYMINPGYVSELWVMEEPFIIPGVFPCGWIVIGIGAIMIGLGAFAVQKVIQIEV